MGRFDCLSYVLLLKILSVLDPTTYVLLTCDDKKGAESIILNEASAHHAKLIAKPSASSSAQSSATISSNKNM